MRASWHWLSCLVCSTQLATFSCKQNMQSLYRVSEEVVLAGVPSQSHLVFHFVMQLFAASIAAVISWQSCPPLYDVFHQRLLNCIYLRPSMWRITGGPAEFPRNGCLRSLAAITRALQLHEKHRPDTQLAIGPFSSEMLLKHCAFIGLAGWYNSTAPSCVPGVSYASSCFDM